MSDLAPSKKRLMAGLGLASATLLAAVAANLAAGMIVGLVLGAFVGTGVALRLCDLARGRSRLPAWGLENPPSKPQLFENLFLFGYYVPRKKGA